jgi:hypothetical protein
MFNKTESGLYTVGRFIDGGIHLFADDVILDFWPKLLEKIPGKDQTFYFGCALRDGITVNDYDATKTTLAKGITRIDKRYAISLHDTFVRPDILFDHLNKCELPEHLYRLLANAVMEKYPRHYELRIQGEPDIDIISIPVKAFVDPKSVRIRAETWKSMDNKKHEVKLFNLDFRSEATLRYLGELDDSSSEEKQRELFEKAGID